MQFPLRFKNDMIYLLKFCKMLKLEELSFTVTDRLWESFRADAPTIVVKNEWPNKFIQPLEMAELVEIFK